MKEQDTELERNLAKAWLQLNEAMVPIYPEGHPKHDPNAVYNDDPGEDEEDTPEMVQQEKIKSWNENIEDVEYFFNNAIWEVEEKIETYHFDKEELAVWNDVRYNLRVLQEKYLKLKK